jgi:hypothetical protein
MHFMFMHLLFSPSRSRQDLSNKVINERIWYNNLQLILINLASTMLIYLKNSTVLSSKFHFYSDRTKVVNLVFGCKKIDNHFAKRSLLKKKKIPLATIFLK